MWLGHFYCFSIWSIGYWCKSHMHRFCLDMIHVASFMHAGYQSLAGTKKIPHAHQISLNNEPTSMPKNWGFLVNKCASAQLWWLYVYISTCLFRIRVSLKPLNLSLSIGRVSSAGYPHPPLSQFFATSGRCSHTSVALLAFFLLRLLCVCVCIKLKTCCGSEQFNFLPPPPSPTLRHPPPCSPLWIGQFRKSLRRCLWRISWRPLDHSEEFGNETRHSCKSQPHEWNITFFVQVKEVNAALERDKDITTKLESQIDDIKRFKESAHLHSLLIGITDLLGPDHILVTLLQVGAWTISEDKFK